MEKRKLTRPDSMEFRQVIEKAASSQMIVTNLLNRLLQIEHEFAKFEEGLNTNTDMIVSVRQILKWKE